MENYLKLIFSLLKFGVQILCQYQLLQNVAFWRGEKAVHCCTQLNLLVLHDDLIITQLLSSSQ